MIDIRIFSYSDLNTNKWTINVTTPTKSHDFALKYSYLCSQKNIDILKTYTSILYNIIPYNHIDKITGVWLLTMYSSDRYIKARFQYSNNKAWDTCTSGYIDISTNVSFMILKKSNLKEVNLFSIGLEEPGSINRLKHEYRNFARITNRVERKWSKL